MAQFIKTIDTAGFFTTHNASGLNFIFIIIKMKGLLVPKWSKAYTANTTSLSRFMNRHFNLAVAGK
jgi:hypothetical protein